MKSVLFFLCFLFCFPAQAQEKILNYDSEIRVRKDASAVVTETITVRAEGKNIRRGIYRDLPRTRGVSYSVLSVKKNGEPEPYFTENSGRMFRINTGTDELLPANGLYTYEIKYRASNVVRPYPEYDEIYWNVTGNGWNFSILSAAARVILPPGASIRQQTGYFGPERSRNRAVLKNGVFAAPRVLSAQEGLTVAVGFDKGFVVYPEKLLPDIDPIWGGAAILLAYGFITWFLYGRDPQELEIMPRFDPPANLTAAQAGAVYYYGMKPFLCFSAALIQGSVSGFLKFSEKEKIVKIERLRDAENGEEKFMQKNLTFPVLLPGTYNAEVSGFFVKFKKFLREKSKPYYVRNGAFTVGAAFLLLLIVTGLCFINDTLDLLQNLAVTLLLLYGSGRNLYVVLNSSDSGWSRFFVSLILLLQTCAFLFLAFLSVPDSSAADGTREIIIFFAVSGLALPVYYYLMHQPTEKGQRLFEHMDGLKMFMTAVRRDYPKEISFEKMEKLLPYAVLFQIEQEWLEKMKSMLKGLNFDPDEYRMREAYYTTLFRLRLERTVRSASTAPVRSGSGGGGFVGGGFGGGGGGGR